jgi:putative ABC transport system permease protein
MLATLSAILFALAPALGAARTDLIPSLKEGLPGSGRRSRVRGVLVAAQVALSLVLLAGAGTGIATMRRAMRTSPVSAADEILLGSVDLDVLGYDAARGAAFYGNLLEQVRALPGVAAASLGLAIPPEEYFGRRAVFHPGEEPPLHAFQNSEFDYGLWVDDDLIAPGFFQTLGIPLLKGRDFSSQDRAGAPRVGIVNEALAARLWPGRDPIGQQIIAPDFTGPARGPISIVGEVKDAVVRSPAGATTLKLYLPLSQEYGGRATLIARAPGGSAKLAKALRETVAGIDPQVPLFAVQTMPQHIDAALWRQRLAAGLLGVFGMLAVGLAAMGLYGVAAHSVAQRTREIGIRMALGAAGQQISAMVVREGALWVAAGAAVGLPAALLGTWAMQKGIPGAKANDPWVLGGTLAALAAVAMLACYLPARRASRVDPVVALRCE